MKYLFLVLLFVSSLSLADSSSTSAAQAGSVSGSGAIASPNQNINFNTDGSGSLRIRTTPDVFAPAIGVSAPCQTALSGGVSVMGFGGSLGGSKEDTGCTMRETARVLSEMGQPAAGLRVMCNNPMAAKALGEAICPVDLTKVTE